MMRKTILLLAPFLMAQNNSPPLVPEGVHSLSNGPSEMCGITASSPDQFEAKVKADPSYGPMERHGDFRVYFREDPTAQWVFATDGYFARPLATCRSIEKQPDGSLGMKREMKCDDSRENCDRAFLEFQALDQRTIKAVQEKTGG